MKSNFKYLNVLFMLLLIFVSMQISFEQASQFCEVKITDCSSGKIIFRGEQKCSEEFILELLKNNENFFVDFTNSNIGKAYPNRLSRIKLNNTYIMCWEYQSIPLTTKCNLNNKYINNYRIDIINRIRGRGS